MSPHVKAKLERLEYPGQKSEHVATGLNAKTCGEDVIERKNIRKNSDDTVIGA